MDETDREWVERRAINVLGHELRTPVTTVRGLAELLAAGVEPDLQAELVDRLLRNARRLEGLVDDLLAAAEVTTALPVGPAGPVDVADQVRALWPGPGLDVVGDEVLWVRDLSVRRILGAAFDNARAYGSLPVTVTVSRDDHQVRTVVDSPGPRLPPEDVRLAVEPFWRGERAVTTAPGLGVGLTVARILAEHEGGRLWVEERPEGGLLTLFELPAATAGH